MKITVKSTNSAKSAFGILSSFQNFRFQRFNFTQNPLFPASGLATGSFNGLHPRGAGEWSRYCLGRSVIYGALLTARIH